MNNRKGTKKQQIVARDWTRWRDRREKQLAQHLKSYGDYRDILKNELSRRQSLSCHYSLRDFANDMGISPSQLSRVLKKERGLSRKSAIQAAQTLGLSINAAQYFIFHVQALSDRAYWKRGLARQGLKRPWIEKAQGEFEQLRKSRPRWKSQ